MYLTRPPDHQRLTVTEDERTLGTASQRGVHSDCEETHFCFTSLTHCSFSSFLFQEGGALENPVEGKT